MQDYSQWDGFEGRLWKEEVNVRDFIQNNYTPYEGDESFLAGPTEATDRLWGFYRGCRRRREPRAVSWTWIPILCPASPPTSLGT